ncbi:hypothetical protein HR060_10685 [Catenovulum sp. SM1970]|nr:hypothetical protein [Marinifaba aquimaris]NTS77330.1 hypothetical protein [Marinifaba aquimaris]
MDIIEASNGQIDLSQTLMWESVNKVPEPRNALLILFLPLIARAVCKSR